MLVFLILSLIFNATANSQLIFNGIYDILNETIEYNHQIFWIMNHIEILNDERLTNDEIMPCLDVVIYPKIISDSSRYYMLELFLKFMSEKFNHPIRIQFSIDHEVNDFIRCFMHLMINLKNDDYVEDFKPWHNGRSSKYMYMILPFGNDDIRPELWPDVFSHPRLKLIVGYRVYQLSNPFVSMPRRFEEIDSDSKVFHSSQIDLSLIRNFNGKQINVTTVPCQPAHNWKNDAVALGKSIPKNGDMEYVCSKNENESTRGCSEFLISLK